MSLDTLQLELRDFIAASAKRLNCTEIIYCTEYLGYLPYGMYHWIDFDGSTDVMNRFPKEWSQSDLKALEQVGFLELLGYYENDHDSSETKTAYRVNLAPPPG